MILNNFAGVELSGRYVIVQMDNGEDVPLNLREVMAFGEKGETPRSELHRFVKNEKNLLYVCGAGVNINVER